MNRSVLFLQVVVVLVVAGLLGTTSPHELLPGTESATPFLVSIRQTSQSGGCIAQFSMRCPQLGPPSEPCGGCASATDRCLTNEPEAVVDRNKLVHFVMSVFDGRMGYQGTQSPNPVICGYWMQCMGGCVAIPESNKFYCDAEAVSGISYISTLVNPNIIVTCDNTDLTHRTPESDLSETLAMSNGVGVKIFQ